MQIVQVSDIHIGESYFKQDVFDILVDEVNNKLKPDALQAISQMRGYYISLNVPVRKLAGLTALT